MRISRAFVIFALAGSSALAQMGTTGSLRDPRQDSTQQAGPAIIEPWLAVTGGYDTEVVTPAGQAAAIYRPLGLSGGLSMVKPFRKTTVVLGYSGTGYRSLGNSGAENGWFVSNVVDLSVGTQLSRRLTFNVGELAGAANGGFGINAWGLGASSNGVLESIGVASGSLYGGSGIPSGTSTTNPLQNQQVDTESSSQMTYFSNTNASLGVLLTRRTMLSFGGSAMITRRVGSSFSDSDGYTGSVGLNTRWTNRFNTSGSYSFTRFDFVNSIGYTNINSISAGAQYQLSAHDSVSGSFGASFLGTEFLATLTLPPDIAQLLGVPVVYLITNRSEHFVIGSAGYSHSYRRGGFGLSCTSSVTPGNDVLVLTRMESCGANLSRSLTRRLSVSGVGGGTRMNGLAQAGTRFDVFDAGLTFSYRFLGGLAFTAGGNYYVNYFKPSTASTSFVSANAGLFWSPARGLKLF